MFRVVNKLKVVKDAIKTLNRSSGHVSKNILDLRSRLHRP